MTQKRDMQQERENELLQKVEQLQKQLSSYKESSAAALSEQRLQAELISEQRLQMEAIKAERNHLENMNSLLLEKSVKARSREKKFDETMEKGNDK